MRFLNFLKRHWLELVAFCDLELFVWSITRRYYNRPATAQWRMVLDGVILFSGIVLVICAKRLTERWRQHSIEKLRVMSRKLLRQMSERVLRILEHFQQRRGRGMGDLLGGRTRIEYDLFGKRERRKKQRRAAWKQLEDEAGRIRWLYAGMVETRLRRGEHIRPCDTPNHIAQRENTTPEECELIGMYTDCRYNRPHDLPEGNAARWRDRNT